MGQVVSCFVSTSDNRFDRSFDFAFANYGNREILIRSGEVTPVPWPDDISLFPEPVEADGFPMVVKPGEIKLAKIRILANELLSFKCKE